MEKIYKHIYIVNSSVYIVTSRQQAADTSLSKQLMPDILRNLALSNAECMASTLESSSKIEQQEKRQLEGGSPVLGRMMPL